MDGKERERERERERKREREKERKREREKEREKKKERNIGRCSIFAPSLSDLPILNQGKLLKEKG